jgi:hypothetical protein
MVLALFITLPALAEYRAYQYLVRSNDAYAVATKAEPQFVVSTLNPAMYRTYHGGNSVSLDLLRTWICPGYTGSRRPVCPNPYDQAEEQR